MGLMAMAQMAMAQMAMARMAMARMAMAQMAMAPTTVVQMMAKKVWKREEQLKARAMKAYVTIRVL